MNQKMVAQALELLALEKQETVLDLFCGLGNFSLPMAKLAKAVVGVEGEQALVDKAQANAALNEVDNSAFFQADLREDPSGQPLGSAGIRQDSVGSASQRCAGSRAPHSQAGSKAYRLRFLSSG